MGQGSGTNPLKIARILERILECLPLKDLKASRLVSKFWRECGIAPMKTKENNGVVLGYFDNKTIHDLAEFVQCLNSVAGGTANFPCSKVFVNASLIRRNKKERNQDQFLFANFLQEISPWVTVLGLRTDLGKTIIANAFPRNLNFPKLKLLKLRPYGSIRTDPSKGSAGNFYRFVTSILEKAPSLRMIDFMVDNHSVDATIKARNSSFTEMGIFGPINNSSLKKFRKWDREMKLKSVELMFVKSEINNTSLFRFLRSQRDSLETLVLYVSRISSPIVVIFPEMPKLKSLTIKLPIHIDKNDDAEDEQGLVRFPVIWYQRQFPALKILHLNPCGCFCEAVSLFKKFIKEEMPPVETIEELSLPSSYIQDESLLTAQNVVRIFPNVKKLNMAADPVMLPIIFKHWTSLEQLTLCYHGIPCRLYGPVNRALMGQTRLEYKRLQKRIERDGENFDWKRLKRNAKESIVNLQKLRVLRFEKAEGSRELEVGRMPLHLILREIRSLRCVDFGDRYYPIDQTEKVCWAGLNRDCVVLWNHI